MDDLAQQLQNILNTEEGQQNLKRVADMLGTNMGNGSESSVNSNSYQNSPTAQSAPSNNIDLSALANLLSGGNQSNNSDKNNSGMDLSALINMLGNQGGNTQDTASPPPNNINGLDINMLLKMQKLMSTANNEDKNTALIRAIMPHLKKERQSRADEAIRMMQLMNMLPMLKESGLFGGGG